MNSFYLIAAIALSAAIGWPATALAAINKCTGADGKTVFSDQPCAAGQAATIVKPAAPAKASGAAASPKNPMTDAQARINSALGPECAAMAAKIRGFVLEGTGATTESQITATVNRFDNQCAENMRKADAAENARQRDEQKRAVVASECEAKKRVVQERRARPGGVSEADKPAVAAIDAENARGCP